MSAALTENRDSIPFFFSFFLFFFFKSSVQADIRQLEKQAGRPAGGSAARQANGLVGRQVGRPSQAEDCKQAAR